MTTLTCPATHPAVEHPSGLRTSVTTADGFGLTRRTLLGSALTLAGLASSGRASAVATANGAVVPFRIAVPQRDLEDLRLRLDMTRWPDRETVQDRSQGVRLGQMQALVQYWRSQYDWRKAEAKLNRLPQFRTRIDGLDFYFLHIRSRHANALPLIMTHGWPGSVLEFMKTIGPLTDPTSHGGRADQAFHLVLPALPGFGFSDKPASPGWNHERTANAWAQLMARLGYERYVAQGGDWGAVVTTLMAASKAKGLVGIHLNFPLVMPEVLPVNMTVEEQAAVDAIRVYNETRSGYFKQQATKPQTIGFALADSPVGQAAWIYDHYVDATQSDGVPERVLTRDEILDEITLYWLTNTGTSAARTYWENAKFSFNPQPIDLPVGVTVFPGEVYLPPRAWGEAAYRKLVYWNRAARGGHFAALEQPSLFVDELRACFDLMRAV